MKADAQSCGEPTRSADGFVAEVVEFKKRSRFVRRCMLSIPRWITPNGVTAFRGLLAAPIVLLLMCGTYWAALGTFAAALALDFVDGALAEARNQKTELGAFLDPLADKVLICAPLLAVWNGLPLVPGQILVAATVVIAVALTLVRVLNMTGSRKDSDGQADIKARPVGKFKLLAETAAVLCVLLGLALETQPLVYGGLALLGIAVILAAGSLRSHLLRPAA